MAVPRPTFQQRLFADEDLPVPLHDQIVRWTDKTLKGSLYPILQALDIKHIVDAEGVCRAWARTEVWDDLPSYSGLERAARMIALRLAPSKPDPEPILVTGIKWEPILKDDRSVIIGAVDLRATIRVPVARLSLKSDHLVREQVEWVAQFIKSDTDYLISDGQYSWLNLAQQPLPERPPKLPEGVKGIIAGWRSTYAVKEVRWLKSQEFSETHLYVEAKTKIKTAGELLRQINLYRSVTGEQCRYLVVAPASELDLEIKDILIEQKVSVLNYMSN